MDDVCSTSKGISIGIYGENMTGTYCGNIVEDSIC